MKLGRAQAPLGPTLATPLLEYTFGIIIPINAFCNSDCPPHDRSGFAAIMHFGVYYIELKAWSDKPSLVFDTQLPNRPQLECTIDLV